MDEFDEMFDIDLTDIFNINLPEIIGNFMKSAKTLFNIMDRNKDKLLERKEWKRIEKNLEKLGINKQDFFGIFQDLDLNNDNTLNLNEFQGFLNSILARKESEPFLGCAILAIGFIWLVLSIIVQAF